MVRVKRRLFQGISLLLAWAGFAACNEQQGTAAHHLFNSLDARETGLDFNNELKPSNEFNIFKYLYFYNGAGIGAGDFNKDGKIDIFFAANQTNNRLYLNKGDLKFEDKTTAAGIPEDGGWSTGVSVVDINNDGMLDIYVCRVGRYEILNAHNQLLVCQGINENGIPVFKDEAKAYGLDFSGFCTQAAFFDYDGDGDLDLYLLNHSIHQNGTFGRRDQLLQTVNALSGDRIFQNNGNNTFTDVTKKTGINSSVLEYGLGITVSDIDLDGYPDIYAANDFHENDYLYINQHDGTFKDDRHNHMMHTSQYSMGVDVADLNNDAFPEIISMDMLPSDPEILKRSLGEDEYDLYYEKLGYGYDYQYTRNNLQLNRRNGMFSEVGLYSGVATTDWSWAPLLMDFDNDGMKDLFISNGISKRLNDIDYINFVSDAAIQAKMREDKLDENDMLLINKFPQKKIPNRFFRNTGNMAFADDEVNVGGNKPTYSNGAVYADFDNDGDLDIVVSNIDEAATFYENTTNNDSARDFMEITLKGAPKNINAEGAKVIVYAGSNVRTYEKYPVRGFMSSMETPLHIGLDKASPDSIVVVWPDNTCERIADLKKQFISLSYRQGLPAFDYAALTSRIHNPTRAMEDITAQTGILYRHREDAFQEFNREPLIPHMISTEGPALAVGDINGDGLEDVFLGSSRRYKSAVFVQHASGSFSKMTEPALDNDSVYEDIDACITDVNGDGASDLIVASGGNEFFARDIYLMPRVYLNNGTGGFTRMTDAFDSLYVNASCVAPIDFNGDGFMDLFIGGRSVPWEYGKVPHSYLLQNDGHGKFKDVTASIAKELPEAGFVTKALWFDIDRDGDKDLLLSLEWGGICAYLNNKGMFTKKLLSDKRGWWNFMLPVDMNNDGNIDLIAGNLGLNSRLHASDKEPVRLYYNDFDGNGKNEQVVTYYMQHKEYPFANKGELEKQIPVIRKRFLYAEGFAKASLADIFTEKKLQTSDTLTANYFYNAILMNNGNLNFTAREMPWLEQLSPLKDAVVVDANGDKLPDVLLVGNYYENNIQMGRYDADFGTILLNKGNGDFSAENINGLAIKGQSRHIAKINIQGKEAFIIARNDDSTMVIRFK